MNKLLLRISKNNNYLSITGYLIAALLELGNIFLLSRTYSKPVFGHWALYLTGITLLDMLRYGLLAQPLIKYIAGVAKREQQKMTSAVWKGGVLLNIVFAVILLPLYFFSTHSKSLSGYNFFLLWGTLYSIGATTPNLSIAIAQGNKKFKRVLVIRILNRLPFIIFLIPNFLFLKVSLHYICLIQILFYFISSLVCILIGWSEISTLFIKAKGYLKKIIHFGKYTMGTTIGSNLLRTTDVFLISYFMSSTEVAIFTIPLRLYEAFNIPLMGLSSVAFMKMSAEDNNNNPQKIRQLFYQYTGITSLLFIPLIILFYFLTSQLIVFMGGSQYNNDNSSVAVFHLFLMSAFFLPLDRFSGTCLDAIKKPQWTFYKVIFMVLINLIGDIMVLIFFQTLTAVAMMTIVNIIAGALIGYIFLIKTLKISFRKMISSLRYFFKQLSQLQKS